MSTNKIESRMNFRKSEQNSNFPSSNFQSQISSNLNTPNNPTNNVLPNP